MNVSPVISTYFPAFNITSLYITTHYPEITPTLCPSNINLICFSKTKELVRNGQKELVRNDQDLRADKDW